MAWWRLPLLTLAWEASLAAAQDADCSAAADELELTEDAVLLARVHVSPNGDLVLPEVHDKEGESGVLMQTPDEFEEADAKTDREKAAAAEADAKTDEEKAAAAEVDVEGAAPPSSLLQQGATTRSSADAATEAQLLELQVAELEARGRALDARGFALDERERALNGAERALNERERLMQMKQAAVPADLRFSDLSEGDMANFDGQAISPDVIKHRKDEHKPLIHPLARRVMLQVSLAIVVTCLGWWIYSLCRSDSSRQERPRFRDASPVSPRSGLRAPAHGDEHEPTRAPTAREANVARPTLEALKAYPRTAMDPSAQCPLSPTSAVRDMSPSSAMRVVRALSPRTVMTVVRTMAPGGSHSTEAPQSPVTRARMASPKPQMVRNLASPVTSPSAAYRAVSPGRAGSAIVRNKSDGDAPGRTRLGGAGSN